VAVFRPFRGIRYNIEKMGAEWSALVAPPYDVLSEPGKKALLSRSEFNIVAIDLPYVPPTKAGPPEVYAAAQDRLRNWLAEGVLVREAAPALYVYRQTFEHAGHEYTRRMVLAAMRLEAFGQGTVFPHEKTHAGPKEDRLALMQATRMQLSPVFGLFSDGANSVAAGTEAAARAPDAIATLDGVTNRLWIETDAEAMTHVDFLLQNQAVYVADGHHRYTTALNYRDALAAAAGGSLPDDHPANYVLVCLCAMEDEGLLILPTHRVLTGLAGMKSDELIDRWADACAFTEVGPTAWSEEATKAELPHDVIVYVAAEDRYFAGRFTRREKLAELCPDQSEAWCGLDLAYLHRYLIETLLDGLATELSYSPRVEEARAMAKSNGSVAILVKPTMMAQLRAVSQAGDLMPQKSTYFYPKIATGLVMHPLA
jgi:uncharacterized protein (DUF1015 family)